MYRHYRSRKEVLAKPLERETSYYNPRTGQKEQGKAGDYWVKDGQHERIEDGETFRREWEDLTA